MNDIVIKTNELIFLIKDSKEYKKYIELKNTISKDKEITNLIEEIKIYQKEIVKLKVKGINYSEQDKLINRNIELLESFPIYVEFNYIQEDLNDLFKKIKRTIECCINDIIN